MTAATALSLTGASVAVGSSAVPAALDGAAPPVGRVVTERNLRRNMCVRRASELKSRNCCEQGETHRLLCGP